MRKHGWQLPYHPLQVVAVAVFLALGFAFYVFFAPFVGRQLFQYILMGIYTPLIICVFSLYIWCAAADPADPGVFRSKKYLKIPASIKHVRLNESKLGAESTSSIQDATAATPGERVFDKSNKIIDKRSECIENDKENMSSHQISCFMAMLTLLPCAYVCNSNEESSELQMSEDGMFYCSLCEVEVFKYSKHCRVCDKCVDRFDHHCRWLNNCIGKRNYRKFFTLMVFALLLLILQWSTGILVLVRCFLERNEFSVDISSKLGSSFTVVPFVIVEAVCTILAMIATLPLIQLFFFHILLIKKGISTYDYIIALREQEQLAAAGQQSPQMSPRSSLTGLSSASSINTFHRAAWCTPPRLFVEDQFDVVPPDNLSVSSLGKKTLIEESTKKKNPAAVKISPWTLARLNADEVSQAAAEARKKSKILQPVARREGTYSLETGSSFGSSGRRMTPRPDNNRKRGSKRIRLPTDMPFDPHFKISSENAENNRDNAIPKTSTGLVSLQREARSAFRTSRAMPSSAHIVGSSPESSLDSPDLHPFRVSSSGGEEARQLVGLSTAGMAFQKEIPFSRSTSDGYEASGGEDSDQITSRFVQRSTNWSSLLFPSEQNRTVTKLTMPSSSSALSNHRKI
ncbi:probable protein S-acyltransferase 22 [Olea europaea var. sylvestris]|uniref:probable protein S-acyltransferase 22 n=1 Tax=Olea europaea var. sylvestris TaxID=158386 RepID=UPI000C1D71FC|nr:probable protein S-acyltransferase 22 [Olea europaea var. sylvestris]